MELQLHDRVKMKKPHPCGCAIFEVTRLGVDYKLKCTGCGREAATPDQGGKADPRGGTGRVARLLFII